MESVKKTYPTSAQKSRLLELIEADNELRQGKFSAQFTRKESEMRWGRIAQEVNSIPGARKEWKDWKKTWQDIKSKTKKKNSDINRSQNATGGGPPVPPLTEEDSIVLRTIGQSALVGHKDVKESVVEFEEVDMENIEIEVVTTAEVEESLPTQEVKEADIDKKRRPKQKAQKRLQDSINVATALQKSLQEKNNIKKWFYEEFIKQMQQQTLALQEIAKNLSKK